MSVTDPIELGWFTLCVPAGDLDETREFYESLGFIAVGGAKEHGYLVVSNGAAELTPMGFLEENLMNFRGGDIPALARELESRGFTLKDHHVYDPSKWPPAYNNDDSGKPLPYEDSGDFTVVDPDGNSLYFDSVPTERAMYRSDQRYCTPLSGAVRAEPALGPMLYHVPVRDLAAAREFYSRLGLSVTEETPERTVLANHERIGFRIALCPGAEGPWVEFAPGRGTPEVHRDPRGLELRIV
jgi:catechol 2,3-dioxygenase-like lactoylglutathione lyase family enzyme